MSPKTKIPASSSSPTTTTLTTTTKTSSSSHHHRHHNRPHTDAARDGLSAYVEAPASYPGSRVIFHDADFVAINDLYPKASVHALLLPRSAALRRLHPFDAFNSGSGSGSDESKSAFLAAVREQAARLKRIVAKELQRRFGACSVLDARREAVLDGRVLLLPPEEEEGDDKQEQKEQQQEQQQQQGEKMKGKGKEGEEEDTDAQGLPLPKPTVSLPPGRDWEAEVLVGVHAHPSMNDLHVHVVSREMRSECLKHRRHYNSFATPFFVPLDDFPLAPDDPRRHPGRAGYLARDLRCWRCGRDFGNRFKALKGHLEGEFEAWKLV